MYRFAALQLKLKVRDVQSIITEARWPMLENSILLIAYKRTNLIGMGKSMATR